ncbi:MAG: hypothetical protein ACKPKO_05885, partial [Candidatus Fonsibacter sp.]
MNTDATARFGVASSETEDAFAFPATVAGQDDIDEIPQIQDADEGPEFSASSLIIADVVMQSLNSTLTASHVVGAEGSSGPETSLGHRLLACRAKTKAVFQA